MEFERDPVTHIDRHKDRPTKRQGQSDRDIQAVTYIDRHTNRPTKRHGQSDKQRHSGSHT